MFTAQVYTVQILCLSGIMDEMHLAQEIIRKWNQENAQSEGKLFLQMSEASTPGDADVVIGIVGNYIDNAKADVIEASVKAGKKVLLFFSEYQDPENTIPSEGVVVVVFRKKMDSKCVCCEFSGRMDFEKVISEALQTIKK
jgi:co-chaperonin GroES (HSP10)